MYRQLPRFPAPSLGNSPGYRQQQELEGLSDVFKKIGGAVKRVVQAGVGAAKQPVAQAVTSAAVSELRQVPGYPGILTEQNRQQASSVVRDNLPIIMAVGGVVLLAMLTRRR